jgi:hypothetical protein
MGGQVEVDQSAPLVRHKEEDAHGLEGLHHEQIRFPAPPAHCVRLCDRPGLVAEAPGAARTDGSTWHAPPRHVSKRLTSSSGSAGLRTSTRRIRSFTRGGVRLAVLRIITSKLGACEQLSVDLPLRVGHVSIAHASQISLHSVVVLDNRISKWYHALGRVLWGRTLPPQRWAECT